MSYRTTLLCIALSVGGINLAVAAMPDFVSVTGGRVSGAQEGALTVYRGIPFAAPPTGELRWRPPAPLIAWDGVLAADHFGDTCPQGRVTEDGLLAKGISEDCLYLNVWTPARSAEERLPVMVWIYGGGFRAGATSVPLYSGERLAAHGVVVVSVAYRVGVFGFMAHPELSRENERVTWTYASGNYGLLDQIAGLKWVRDNISAFGGDPSRVTIFGESAGGISVSMLAASPLAKGLFQGAISESGGSFGPARFPGYPGENIPPLAAAEAAGVRLGEKLGDASIEAMRGAAAGAVLKASGSIRGIGWPILDGWVIPDDQYALYAAARYNDTPILVGINSDEGAMFSRVTATDEFEQMTVERYGPYAEKLLDVYPPDDKGAIRQAARDLARDAAFGWHTWVWAKLQNSGGGSPAYVYFFDQRPPYGDTSPMRGALGTPHGAELPYVFQHLDQYPNTAWTDDDRAISDAVATYWTNFVKRGNPNDDTLPQWPPFSSDKPLRMVFHGVPHARPYDNMDQLNTLDAYFAWRRTPEGRAFAEEQP